MACELAPCQFKCVWMCGEFGESGTWSTLSLKMWVTDLFLHLQGKMVFGNYQLPTTLSINFGDAHTVYTTKSASTPFDLFMHIVKCRVDNIRVMLVPSPKYNGLVNE